MKKILSWLSGIATIFGVIWLILSQIRSKQKSSKLKKSVDKVEHGIHDEVYAAMKNHEASEEEAKKAKEINEKANEKIQDLKKTNPTAAAIVNNWNQRLHND